MKNDLHNILGNLNKEAGQEKLLEYLKKQLEDSERHEFEKQMLDDEFMNDAAEGLEMVEDKKELDTVMMQLNRGLKKQLETRRKGKKVLFFNHPWSYVAILLILIIVIAAFLLLRKMGV